MFSILFSAALDADRAAPADSCRHAHAGDTPSRSPTRRPVAPTAWRLRARRPCFGAMRVLLGTFVFLAAGFCVSTILCQELQLPKTTHRHAIRRRSLQQDMPWGPRKTKKGNSRYVGNRSAAVKRDQLFGTSISRRVMLRRPERWQMIEQPRDDPQSSLDITAPPYTPQGTGTVLAVITNHRCASPLTGISRCSRRRAGVLPCTKCQA